MGGYWCKNCNEFVGMKKDYTRAKVILLIYLFAILIGLVAFFPWGGLIVLLGGGVVMLQLPGAHVVFHRLACSICGRTVKFKKNKK